MALTGYEEIRPYNDSEVGEKIGLLLADPVFDRVLKILLRDPERVMAARQHLAGIQTVHQLQASFVYQLVEEIVRNTTQGLTCSGLDNLDHRKAFLFISNHRDIILDAAFLNYLIYENGMNTTQIAIGDNLLIYDWIIHAVKLNRAFVVKRNIAARELLAASKKLSSYIRKSITADNISVWIAQREGRTKDGDDQTQLSLLKMLNMSNHKSLADGFGELTIIPLAISYEIEPCGISKVDELILKESEEGFTKTTADDLKSMANGMMNPKGRVHFSFGKPILTSFLEANKDLPANDFIQELARRIDHRIYQNYHLWPNNYVAYDLLNGTGEFIDFYSADDIVSFKKMVAEAQAALPHHSPEEVARRFYNMYARPVENSLIAAEVFRT